MRRIATTIMAVAALMATAGGSAMAAAWGAAAPTITGAPPTAADTAATARVVNAVGRFEQARTAVYPAQQTAERAFVAHLHQGCPGVLATAPSALQVAFAKAAVEELIGTESHGFQKGLGGLASTLNQVHYDDQSTEAEVHGLGVVVADVVALGRRPEPDVCGLALHAVGLAKPTVPRAIQRYLIGFPSQAEQSDPITVLLRDVRSDADEAQRAQIGVLLSRAARFDAAALPFQQQILTHLSETLGLIS